LLTSLIPSVGGSSLPGHQLSNFFLDKEENEVFQNDECIIKPESCPGGQVLDLQSLQCVLEPATDGDDSATDGDDSATDGDDSATDGDDSATDGDDSATDGDESGGNDSDESETEDSNN
jgi:hypothetical protein